jgi:hypothetical protein
MQTATQTHSFSLIGPSDPFFSRVSIRMATAGDQPSLERLAQLDSARPPEGLTLLGEVNGRPVAALSLSDGRTIADPFTLSAPILELVRVRSRQLRPKARGADGRRLGARQ